MTIGLAAPMVNGWLDALRSSLYAELHIGDPGANGTANPSVGSTTRVVATFNAANGGSISLNGTNPSWTNGMGSGSENISHLAFFDAATGGTFKGSAALSAAKSWGPADVLTLTSCAISIAPVAA